MTTRYLKKSYFVLYDDNDDIVCYFDDYTELSRILPNYRISDLTCKFSHSDGFIKIVSDNRFYKLFLFME